MARGGKRPGSGRKPGGFDRATDARKFLEQQADKLRDAVPPHIAAMSPLDVMIYAMAMEAKAGQWKAAAVLAEKAAPYVHPRLSSVDMKTTLRDERSLSDAELAAIAAAGGAGATEAAGDTPEPPGVVH